jgi:hypothetical protein
MALRSQDLLVSIELALNPQATYPRLAKALDLSLSEVHGAVRRATDAGLLTPDRRANASALLEFIVHGVKYVWKPKRGGLTRGMPTAHGAPPLNGDLNGSDEPVPVWPDPHGAVRGESFEPLYRSVPKAAKGDPRLHEFLSLVDAIRGGRARERSLAEKHLRRILAS